MAQHKDEMSGIVFRCDYCSKTVKNRHSLLHHLRLHIGKDLPCPHCDRVYKNPDSLKRHVQSTHQGIKRRHQCQLCDKDLWDKHQIVKHIETEHALELASSGKKAEQFVKCIKVQDPDSKVQPNFLHFIDLANKGRQSQSPLPE